MGKRLAAVFAVLILATALVQRARAQSPSVEVKLLELINGARSTPLAMHEGLRSQARSHAADMAAANRITHSGARSRIYRAEPIPAERDGPPDNGFTATWCEIAGWEPARPDENVAQTFFDAWQAKAEDRACMMSGSVTAVGIGMYQSGTKWWASFEAVQDTTRPPLPRPVFAGSSRPKVAAPRATATVTQSKRKTDSSSVGDLTKSSGPSLTPNFGWREIVVAVGAFMVMPLLHTMRRRRADRRLRRTIGLR